MEPAGESVRHRVWLRARVPCCIKPLRRRYRTPIVNFAWEPLGHRFCVIHGEGQRLDVSFHSMKSKETGVDKLSLLKTLEKRQVNNIFWSPTGNFLVLAGFKNFNGILEFWNANEMEMMGQEEHFMASDVEWDPTGRRVSLRPP
jgi:translation initiation factor 3 subunit B